MPFQLPAASLEPMAEPMEVAGESACWAGGQTLKSATQGISAWKVRSPSLLPL